MSRILCLAVTAWLLATAAHANPCGFEEKGRIVIKGYGVGKTAVPQDQQARLSEFAMIAKARSGVCIFAQVDKQGSDAANAQVAQGRAERVREFLSKNGVTGDRMQIAKQEEALTFFGLLSSDQPDDRRVVVTHD